MYPPSGKEVIGGMYPPLERRYRKGQTCPITSYHTSLNFVNSYLPKNWLSIALYLRLEFDNCLQPCHLGLNCVY